MVVDLITFFIFLASIFFSARLHRCAISAF